MVARQSLQCRSCFRLEFKRDAHHFRPFLDGLRFASQVEDDLGGGLDYQLTRRLLLLLLQIASLMDQQYFALLEGQHILLLETFAQHGIDTVRDFLGRLGRFVWTFLGGWGVLS
jgi:hypothetical protein